MAFYVRKISRSKWEKGLPNDPDGDAITGCTRTTSNTLSLWRINDKSTDEINKVLLALACTMEKADSFECLLIECDKIETLFTIENTVMENPYEEMNQQHFDITGIKYTTLKDVADIILDGIANGTVIKPTKKEISNLLINSEATGKIKREALNEKLIKSLWG